MHKTTPALQDARLPRHRALESLPHAYTHGFCVPATANTRDESATKAWSREQSLPADHVYEVVPVHQCFAASACNPGCPAVV